MKVRLAAVAVAALAMPMLLPAAKAFADTMPSAPCCVALGGPAHMSADYADDVNAPGEFPVAPFDETQTLEGQQDIFIKGGQDLGRGAGEVVSAAYIGAPQGILDIPAHVLGWPKPLAYLNEG